MIRKIDIARTFERVDEPPVKQPPDYTDYPSGDVKVVPITVTPKLTSVIPQEGLVKREADIVAISKEFQGLGEKPLPPPPIIHIKPTLRIDVAKKFERVDEPPFKQPPDYTDYPSGDQAINRKKAIIAQEGLMKRRNDIKTRAYDMKKERWLGGLGEEIRKKPMEIKAVKVGSIGGVKFTVLSFPSDRVPPYLATFEIRT